MTPSDRGPHSPTIAVYNQASTPLGLDLTLLVAALQNYLDLAYMPTWGRSATLVMAEGPQPNMWGLVFLDTADAPGALAYHDEENHLPLSKVFVKTTLDANELISVSASHELVEMLTDAPCNRYAQSNDNDYLFAFEVADPVEGDSFAVQGFQMSNFVGPAYFDSDPIGGDSKFDHMGVLTKSFSVAKNGYVIISKEGEEQQVFGSEEKKAAFAMEDRRGHHGWYRMDKSRK